MKETGFHQADEAETLSVNNFTCAVNDVAIAARLLCFVQSSIGSFKDVILRVIFTGNVASTDADGDMVSFAEFLNFPRLYGRTESLGNMFDVSLSAVGQNRCELFATVAVDCAMFTQSRVKRFSYLAKNGVSNGMPEGIVDGFEVVHVDNNQRQALSFPLVIVKC